VSCSTSTVTGRLKFGTTGTVVAPLVPSFSFSCLSKLSTLAFCLSCSFACAFGPGTKAGVGGVVAGFGVGAAEIGNGAGARVGIGAGIGAGAEAGARTGTGTDTGTGAGAGPGAGARAGVGFALSTADANGDGSTCNGVAAELSPALLLFGPSLGSPISAAGAFRLPRAARKLCTKVLR
jgi:hypothetical protein